MLKILSLTLFLTMILHANIISLSPKMEGLSTLSDISFFEDSTKKMNLESIKLQHFKIEHSFRSNRGASKSSWWLKFQVQNNTDKQIDWFLKFYYGGFDILESWQFDDNNLIISHFLKGDHNIDITKTPFNERSTFEFTTHQQEKNTIYVKMSYDNTGMVEMYNSIWTKDEFIKSEQLNINLLTGIISALGVLLFYNIFIFFILRKNEYFWYNAYLVGVIFTVLSYNQLGAHYLWNKSQYLTDLMPILSVVTLFISFVLFTREFLETFKFLPIVDRVLKILVVFNILAIILFHIGAPYIAIKLIQIISFSFMLFPVLGFILWYRGYKIARGYTIASAILSFTILISLLRFSGILQTNDFLFWLSRLGFIVEGILLSIALADRITILEHDKKSAQDKVQHTLEEAKRTLEFEVKKRTKELEIQTKKAELLARTDEMTGIYNRRAFIEHGEILIYDAIRYNTSFSLVILDIDFFKNVNDTYGHDAGDIVLKSFTKEISTHSREGDFFARIGGEEFVILLPHTSAEQALEKTNILLQKINELEIFYKDFILKVTASAGICEYIGHGDTLYSLLAKADKALYYVKENGRNNVHIYKKS